MKKKIFRVIALSLSVLIIIIGITLSLFYVLNNGNPITKYIADKKVPTYLSEKGYAEEEINESHFIEPKHTINRKFFHGHYMVVFKDETDITYYYGITKIGNKVKQFCEKDKLTPAGITEIVQDETKHSEKNCTNSLNRY